VNPRSLRRLERATNHCLGYGGGDRARTLGCISAVTELVAERERASPDPVRAMILDALGLGPERSKVRHAR
jgi:hypothetical protein